MKSIYRGLLAAAFLASLSLPASAGGRSTAVREGSFGRSPSNYVGTGTTSPANPYTGYGTSGVPTSSADLVYPEPVPYPRFEQATPSYNYNPGNDPSANPVVDGQRYEEMNPNTDPIAPSWYSVPMGR